MARYDVHGLASGGLVLDVQSDILEPLNTRIVVPLMPLDAAPAPAKRLNPIFDIDGARYVLATQFLSAVRIRDLGPPQDNLLPQADAITNALDMLMQGF